MGSFSATHGAPTNARQKQQTTRLASCPASLRKQFAFLRCDKSVWMKISTMHMLLWLHYKTVQQGSSSSAGFIIPLPRSSPRWEESRREVRTPASQPFVGRWRDGDGPGELRSASLRPPHTQIVYQKHVVVCDNFLK